MGKQHKTVRIPDDHADSVRQFAQHRNLSESQAMRRLIDRGLIAYSYDRSARGAPSRLYRSLTICAWAALTVGFSWLVVSLVGGPGWRLPAAGAIATSAFMFILRRAEPSISRQLELARIRIGLRLGGIDGD